MGQSQFIITGEVEGLPVAYGEELAGTNVGQYVTDVEYIVDSGNLVVSCVVAINGNISIPEPTTATLSLLALTLLVSRRRRRCSREGKGRRRE